jgi:hypothetical protein
MAIFHGNSIPAGGSGSYYDYEINNSLRFNKDNNPHLTHPNSFSPNSPYTVSCWVKRGKISGNNYVYRINSADNLSFDSNDIINLERRGGSFQTSRVFRDTSAWYHIVVKSTSSDFKLYINGVLEQTGTATANPYSAGTFNIGNLAPGTNSSYAFDGYMAEWHWVDGQALGPENFGEVGTYGDWKPIEYTGSHGSTGFYLDFSNSSSLGNDASANSNHFTLNNITSSDQVKDSPTNNFCTMNPLDNYYAGSTFSQGNLGLFITGSAQPTNTATFGMTSGKWYWEVRQGVSGAGGGGISYLGYLGIAGSLGDASNNQLGENYDHYSLYAYSTAGRNVWHNSTWYSYGTDITYTNGDIISMALDLDNNKMYWAKNGSYVNSGNPAGNSNGFSVLAPSATSLGAYFPAAGDGHSSSENFMFNFGQDGTFAGNVTAGGNSDDNDIGNFKYAPPAGFLSLCTANLAEPAVIPSEHFNTVLYTGTGGARSITGVGFQPDLHWLKIRAGESKSHMITDAVRGAGKYWQSDSGGAENNDIGTVASFDADGWSFGGSTPNQFNYSGRTYVAWNWKAGTSVSSNTSGSGTAKAYTTSYNADAGFSITKYEGNGTAGHTIPHHLGAEPDMIIVKNRVGGDSAYVYSSVVGNTQGLQLSNAGAANTTSAYWNNVSPTSSVWTVASNSGNNSNGSDYIAYCFRNIEGYSKVGSYIGNGSTDGAFVYCGFRPQFLLIKPINYGDGWKMWDTTRGAQNGRYNQYPPGDLKPNQTNTENFSTSFNFDFVSNGFKWRGSDNSVNGGYEYLFYAIAEQPFKHTNAR